MIHSIERMEDEKSRKRKLVRIVKWILGIAAVLGTVFGGLQFFCSSPSMGGTSIYVDAPKLLLTVYENHVECKFSVQVSGRTIEGTEYFLGSQPSSFSKPYTTTSVEVLSNLAKWEFGKLRAEVGGDIVSIESLLQSFSTDRPIICIGAASHEGTVASQNTLAKKRSEHLAFACASRFPKSSIYRLVMGQFRGSSTTTASSRDERPIVILTIDSGSTEPNDIEKALRQALSETTSRYPTLGLDPKDFRLFELIPGRTSAPN